MQSGARIKWRRINSRSNPLFRLMERGERPEQSRGLAGEPGGLLSKRLSYAMFKIAREPRAYSCVGSRAESNLRALFWPPFFRLCAPRNACAEPSHSLSAAPASGSKSGDVNLNTQVGTQGRTLRSCLSSNLRRNLSSSLNVRNYIRSWGWFWVHNRYDSTTVFHSEYQLRQIRSRVWRMYAL